MLLNPIDIERLRREFHSAKPYPFIKIDDFLTTQFATRVEQAYPVYEAAKKSGLEFKGVNEYRKIQITDPQKFPAAIHELYEALAAPDFLGQLTAITGISGLLADPELIGGGMHQTASGGHLDVHVDFNYLEKRELLRRLNILVFFNRDWQEAWGGNLELWDEKVKHCEHSFIPLFNRCVIFETSEVSFHGVTPVASPEGITRKSFAAYYYKSEPAATWKGKTHSTLFKARPDEKMKRFIHMPTENLKHFFVKYIVPKGLLPTLVQLKQRLSKRP